jgi:SAM-dependent methyltransferase
MDKIKNEMTNYWSQRAEKFSLLRQKEFASKKHEQWLAELDRYLPSERKLKILDIGTGTGFFAFLLAERGHQVTGIDLTPGMIAEARKIAERMDGAPDFYIMDGEKPDFPPQSFDAIVTRKMTWALPNLSRTYQNWHGLLKSSGILINFDADYCREEPPASLPKHHAHQDVGEDLMREYEHMKDLLRPTQQPRPGWDAELLTLAGFSHITIDTGVWQRIYMEEDEFYDPTPGFAIAARA